MLTSSNITLILSQVPQKGFFEFPAYILAILFSLSSFLLVVLYWRRWARRAFGDDESGKQAAGSWLLRPSNLLFALAAILFMYGWNQNMRHQGERSAEGLWEILILLAFVIRYWESGALRNVDVDEPIGDEEKKENPRREDGKFD